MAEEKKTYNPDLAKSEEPVLTAGELEDISNKSQAERTAKEVEATKVKKSEQARKEREMFGISPTTTGITQESRMLAKEGYENEIKLQEEKIKAETEKAHKTFTAYIDETAKDMTPEEKLTFLGTSVNTIKHTFATAEFKRLTAFYDSQTKFVDTTMPYLKKLYWLHAGEPDMALDMDQITGRAKELVGDKPETRRGGLDYLLGKGPDQVDMPKMPDDASAYLAETLAGMVGSIVQNAMALGEGGTTLIAKGQAQDPAQKTADKVATMMTMDVAQYREQVEKIRLMNEELRIQYKRDVMSALVDFDNRASADERAYNTSLFQAKGAEISRAYEILEMEERAKQTLANIANFLDTAENNAKLRKDEREVALEKWNAGQKNMAAREDARHAYDLMAMEGKKRMLAEKNKLMPFKRIFDNASILIASGISNTESATNFITTASDFIEKNPTNVKNYSAGMSRGSDLSDKIASYNFTQEEQANIHDNILFMGQSMFTLNNTSEAALRQLAKQKIKLSPSGREFEAGGELVPLFHQRSDREFSYTIGTMHGLLNTVASRVEARKEAYKRSISEKSKEADLNPFPQEE